jgi:hypothetical protein
VLAAREKRDDRQQQQYGRHENRSITVSHAISQCRSLAIFGRRSIGVGRIGRALVVAMPKFGTADGKRPIFGS